MTDQLPNIDEAIAYPLRVLRVENQTAGFAMYHLLGELLPLDISGIGNQPQANDYDPDAPQTVEGSTDFGNRHRRMPPDFYTLGLSFEIPTKPEQMWGAKGTATTYEMSEEGEELTEITRQIEFHHLRLLAKYKDRPRLALDLLAMLPGVPESRVHFYDVAALWRCLNDTPPD